jgi:hypothetical protein
MQCKKYNTVGKSCKNKIVERGEIDTPKDTNT